MAGTSTSIRERRSDGIAPTNWRLAVAGEQDHSTASAISTDRRTDALVIGLLLIAGTAAPLVLSGAAGALDIPRNDDWSYRRIALDLWSTGRLAFDGVAGMMLIGQIIAIQPFLWLTGGSAAAFSMFGAMISGLVTLAVYALARQFVSPARASIVALSLLLFPGYLAYSTSFMSDGPALLAEVVALTIGARAVLRPTPSVSLLALAMATAVAGFSVRQFALAAVGSVALAALGHLPRRPAGSVIAFSGVGACLLLQLLRANLPGELEPLPAQVWFATRLPQAAVTVSLMVIPAAIVAIVTNRRAWRIGDVRAGTAIGIGLVLAVLALWARFGTFPTALLGNLTTRFGVEGVFDASGGRPPLFPDLFWTTMNLIALASTVPVAAAVAGTLGTRLRDARAGRRRLVGQARSPVGLVATFVVLYALGVVAYGGVLIVFDRYLWPLVPALALILVVPVTASRRVGPPKPAAAVSARRPLTLAPLAFTALTAALSLTVMANAFAFDGARWRAGNDLVAAGVNPSAIDAGFEWMGYHSVGRARLAHPVATDPPYRGWWPDTPICGWVTTASEQPAPARLIAVERYPLYLVGGELAPLYAYAIPSAACRPEAATRSQP